MPNTSIKPESLKLIKQFTAKHKIINQGGVRFVDAVLDLIGTVRHAHIMYEEQPKPVHTAEQVAAMRNAFKKAHWPANIAVIEQLELMGRDPLEFSRVVEAVEAAYASTQNKAKDFQTPRQILINRLSEIITPQFYINIHASNRTQIIQWNKILKMIIDECQFTTKPPTYKWVSNQLKAINPA